jgi:hypothetical protein
MAADHTTASYVPYTFSVYFQRAGCGGPLWDGGGVKNLDIIGARCPPVRCTAPVRCTGGWRAPGRAWQPRCDRQGAGSPEEVVLGSGPNVRSSCGSSPRLMTPRTRGAALERHARARQRPRFSHLFRYLKRRYFGISTPVRSRRAGSMHRYLQRLTICRAELHRSAAVEQRSISSSNIRPAATRSFAARVMAVT